MPSAFIASLQTLKGFDEKAFVKVHQSGEQVTSVRLNPYKLLQTSKVSSFERDLEGTVPWSSSAYYLSRRPSFTLDPLFHAGTYYVQEASSIFLEEVLKQTCDLSKPLKILDLCAAPGGKSTLIQSLVCAESLLVSNEIIKARANILTENITKWGAANVVVTNNDPKDFQKLDNYFDVVIVDAPCSGSGLFRKDLHAISEWSDENVRLCSQRQQRILMDIYPSLKPGGVLIYSTCSYSSEEDEAILDWITGSGLQVSGSRLKLRSEWNIIETQSPETNCYGYRFYPDKVKGEGFFIAALQKKGIDIISKEIKTRNKPTLISKQEMNLLRPKIKNADALSFFKWQDEIIAVPSSLLNDVFLLQSSLYIKKAGIKIGSVIRDELIPHHEFALSNFISATIPSVDVDLATALEYLRRNEIIFHTGLKSWALVKYANLPLGWIKILSNRINNYYPKSWRILNK